MAERSCPPTQSDSAFIREAFLTGTWWSNSKPFSEPHVNTATVFLKWSDEVIRAAAGACWTGGDSDSSNLLQPVWWWRLPTHSPVHPKVPRHSWCREPAGELLMRLPEALPELHVWNVCDYQLSRVVHNNTASATRYGTKTSQCATWSSGHLNEVENSLHIHSYFLWLIF